MRDSTNIFAYFVTIIALTQFGCSSQQIQATLDGYEFRCAEPNQLTSAYTKLSGVAFDVDVITLKNGALSPLDSQIKGTAATVDFVQTTDVAACEGGAAAVQGGVSVTISDGLVTSGRQRVSGLTIANSSPALMCRTTAVYQGNSYRKCSSYTFAARPSGFTLTSTNANADSNGTNAVTTDTSKIFKASMSAPVTGTAFNLTASAVNGSGSLLTAYNGFPVIKTANIQGSSVAGSLNSTTFSQAANGVASQSFSYSEVGYFRVLAGGVEDSTYTALDQANGRCIANSSSITKDSNGRIGCNIGSQANSVYFGRFIPYGFVTTPVTNAAACTATGGTTTTPYFGSEFTTTFTIKAVNDGLQTTKNYAGNFAKFASGSVGTTYANYQFQNVSLTNPASTVTISQGSVAPTFTSAWAAGQAEVKATHKLAKPSNTTTPQTIILRALPTDTEASSPSSYLATSSSKVADTSGSNLLTFRYGRLRLNNAYGAETMPLSYAATAQYWTGTEWLTNTADSCTQMTADIIKMRFPASTKNSLAQCNSSINLLGSGKFSNGTANVRFTAPGNGHNGWFYISLKQNPLDTSAITCLLGSAVSTVTSNLTQFGSATSEEALISFGQYKSKLIYSGEQ